MADTLFGAVANTGPETVDLEVMKALASGSIDPRTTEYWNDNTQDVFWDNFEANAVAGTTTEVPNIGTLTVLAEWGTWSDGRDVGFVIRHEETGKAYLFEAEYTSWDSQEYEVSEAEEYVFTELRWRSK